MKGPSPDVAGAEEGLGGEGLRYPTRFQFAMFQ